MNRHGDSAADTTNGAFKMCHACLIGGKDVGYRSTGKGMQMQTNGQVWPARGDGPDAVAHQRRPRQTDAVGQRDFGDAGGYEALDQTENVLFLQHPVVWADEGGAHADGNFESRGSPDLGNLLDLAHIALDRHVGVQPVIRLTRHNETREFWNADRHRALSAAHIRYERPVDGLVRSGEHLARDIFRVGQAGDDSRMYEAGDFDFRYTGVV